MKDVRLEEVARFTGGMVTTGPDTLVSRVSTDTRNLEKGALFVALIGERQDGHRFLERACRRGAAAAVVNRENPHAEHFRRGQPDFPLVLVEDTLTALGDLAAGVRRATEVRVVGITGSTGKTSTKDLLVSILRRRYSTAASPASFNNEIGVPLTLLGSTGSEQLVVVEMGARRKGDITRLSEIARPDAGIITGIGVTHLESFGSREALALAKAELAEAVPDDGRLFLNADCEYYPWLKQRSRCAVFGFGAAGTADYRYSRLALDPSGRPSFRLQGPGLDISVKLSVLGAHHAGNAAAAAACAHQEGCTPEEIAAGLEAAQISAMRLEAVLSPSGFTVINDSYNASPHSMKAALCTLKAMSSGRRTVAVLGGMEELGDDSSSYHREAGRLFAELDLDLLVGIGPRAIDYTEAAVEAGLPRGSAFWCASVKSAVSVLQAVLEPDDLVLVKASRSKKLERVAHSLVSPDFRARGRGAAYV